MIKFGRAMGALTAIRNKFDEDAEEDSDNPKKRPPPDFIDRAEAEKRAGKLIDTIGRDNAKAVCEALRHGFSAGSWRILSEMQRCLSRPSM